VNVETALNEVKPLYCVWDGHADFPVLPNLLWMNEIIKLGTEDEQICYVRPENTIDHELPGTFGKFGSIRFAVQLHPFHKRLVEIIKKY